MRRAKKLYLAMGLALVAMLVAAGAVFAAVTFDPVTGTGFVGKGDVQQAFTWNNKQLQTNAGGVDFQYVEKKVTERECRDDINTNPGPPIYVYETTTITKGVADTIAYDPRVKNQITGFNLTGIESTETINSGGCPDGYQQFGQPIEKSHTVGLFAVYNGTSVQLNWPAAG